MSRVRRRDPLRDPDANDPKKEWFKLLDIRTVITHKRVWDAFQLMKGMKESFDRLQAGDLSNRDRPIIEEELRSYRFQLHQYPAVIWKVTVSLFPELEKEGKGRAGKRKY